MNNALVFVLFGVFGALLGAFFFGGLWWTVKKGMSEKKGGLWFLGSFAVRTCVVVFSFYVISGYGGERLLAALTGFLIAHVTSKIFLFPKGPGVN